jgi:tRNA-specific 2-thiouridylase
MKPKVAVAISGGIDSLITAFILKKKYENIIGFHFLNGFETPALHLSEFEDHSETNSDSSFSISEIPSTHPLIHIRDQLDIPIKIVDCRQYFKKTVIDYFIQSYRRGLTPNPCMICNPLIKFGIIFDLSRQMGASIFATGHYVRIFEKEKGMYLLQRGADTLKDQSYFLALLSKKVLPFLRFPLGEMTKQHVMEIAKQNKLIPVSNKESQDVCFIRNNNYADFIASQDRFSSSPGVITDISGHKIGTHQGLHQFTIGQRRGINCPASEPYYVLKIDKLQNRLIVGYKKDLYKTTLTIKNINWFIPKPFHQLNVSVKIRYQHQAADAILIPDNDSAIIHFKNPQSAITPGQGAVCYINDEVIAGGWIE